MVRKDFAGPAPYPTLYILPPTRESTPLPTALHHTVRRQMSNGTHRPMHAMSLRCRPDSVHSPPPSLTYSTLPSASPPPQLTSKAFPPRSANICACSLPNSLPRSIYHHTIIQRMSISVWTTPIFWHFPHSPDSFPTSIHLSLYHHPKNVYIHTAKICILPSLLSMPTSNIVSEMSTHSSQDLRSRVLECWLGSPKLL